MFGNSINNPFIMSNMYNPINSSMMRSAPMMGNMMMNNTPIMTTPRTGGILSSLFGGRGGITQGLKSFNFGNLLNNTSKALGVVREAIPIVKEVGPMMGNLKQMLKIASIFKDETDINIKNNNQEIKTSSEANTITISKENDTNIISTTTNLNNNEPNFFL